MSVEDWARRESEKVFPLEWRTERAEALGYPPIYNDSRDSYAQGLVHAFSALLSDEAVEAAAKTIPNRWEVDGRCWAQYGGGDEYCQSHFDTEAEAIKHRDDHHTEYATVWAHKEPEELLTEARAALQAAVHAVTEGEKS